jgi:hypothetical protein
MANMNPNKITNSDVNHQTIDSTIYLVNEYVIFLDPISRSQSYGRVISDIDGRHGSVAATMIRSGVTTTSTNYHIEVLGSFSLRDNRLAIELDDLCLHQQKLNEERDGERIAIENNFVDRSPLKTMFFLEENPHMNEFHTAVAVDKAANDTKLLQSLGREKYRMLKQEELFGKQDYVQYDDSALREPPEGYPNTPASAPEEYQRPLSSYLLKNYNPIETSTLVVNKEIKVFPRHVTDSCLPGSVIILSSRELKRPYDLYEERKETIPRIINRVVNIWIAWVRKELLSMGYGLWVGGMQRLRIRKRHIKALKIQTCFRKWLCRNKIENLYKVIVRGRRRRWKDMHKQFEYCPKTTLKCYSFNQVLFFRTLTGAHKHARYTRFHIITIIRFACKKRKILEKFFFYHWLNYIRSMPKELLCHFTTLCVDIDEEPSPENITGEYIIYFFLT